MNLEVALQAGGHCNSETQANSRTVTYLISSREPHLGNTCNHTMVEIGCLYPGSPQNRLNHSNSLHLKQLTCDRGMAKHKLNEEPWITITHMIRRIAGVDGGMKLFDYSRLKRWHGLPVTTRSEGLLTPKKFDGVGS